MSPPADNPPPKWHFNGPPMSTAETDQNAPPSMPETNDGPTKSWADVRNKFGKFGWFKGILNREQSIESLNLQLLIFNLLYLFCSNCKIVSCEFGLLFCEL